MSTVGAVVSIVLLLSIVSAPAGRYARDVEFGGFGCGFIAALAVAVAMNYVCFFAMRPLLWRAPYAVPYRGYRVAPWEKRMGSR